MNNNNRYIQNIENTIQTNFGTFNNTFVRSVSFVRFPLIIS